ncbi:MAG: sigma 54-interacting transcriptional regulator [Lawsonibacter sp.]|jgi:propionate catabolism operon transcriptional regulator|nr:sigma 54-interacting transcriptional regulator [Lawsonibacter sp.]
MGQIAQALIKAIDFMGLDADFILSDSLVHDESRLPPELAKSDVLLSSGYLVKALHKITDKPIIKIEPSLFDILLAYSNALPYDHNPVIILPSESGSPLVGQIQDILSVHIVSDYYDTLADAGRIIRKYKDRGFRCVIGSGLVCEEASAMGLKSIFVYPQESLCSFIQLAYDTAVSICKELEVKQQMSTIFQYSHQGILFTDRQGRISMCNDSAGKILKMTRQQLIGHSIAQFFPPEPLNTVFQSHEVLNHLMCSFGGEQYIASIIPILSKGELSNVMINLDNVRTIQRQEQHIRNALAQKGFVAKHRFDAFESRNPSFHTLVSTAKKFAKSEDCVIILGETGTGKEVLAQSIHNHSARANNPFVAVNCSAISETLLESELFGYDEGAFTGARKGGKQGYFEVAHKGTIFLDEIGELSLPLQSKLLRVIQERQLIHVGGSKVINFDVRIIAATNRNLWELVQQQKFREDLYYRLAVLELELPPLRQRQEDILPLFLEFVAKRSGSLAAQLEEKDATLAHLLCSHSWPGNIRELENFAKTVMTMWGDGDANGTFLDLIGTEIQRRKARSVHTALPHPEPEAVPAQTAEWKRIQGALVEAGGNYTRAAAILGISRVTLWRRLKAMEQTAGTDR